MNRLSHVLTSDTRLLIGALAAVSIIAVLAVLIAPPPAAPAYSTRSTDANGAMALRLWLEQMGYPVREILTNPVQPDTANVLFILGPEASYSNEEADSVRRWVRRGNTLIVAGHQAQVNRLLSPFNVSVDYLFGREGYVTSSSPTLSRPPLNKLLGDPIYRVITSRSDVVTHIIVGSSPVLVSFKEGDGTVWVSGMLTPFTNRGLQDPGNARLILNLLSGVPARAIIAFDEAKHGFTEAPRSIFGWLVTSAPGWGVVIAVILTMIYLALHGRRFGQALPIPDARLRREPVEYIQAMANLFRRSGQRAEILSHYRHQLRRRLSERYAVDPHLDDVDMVKAIVFRDPRVDEVELRKTFARLSRRNASEQDLIGAALDVDTWLRRLT
ncbi:MAG: DUF4350 domain-containing protein [Anaerolineae bacterium]|nr:DUF4350 domain-containing protein [Anaerolineae bacterium]